MFNIENLYKLNKSDLKKAAQALTDAFINDPVWEAMLKDVPDRYKKMYNIFEMTLRHSIKYGYSYSTSKNLEGVALWFHHEKADMTFWRMIRSGAIINIFKIGVRFGRKMIKIMRDMEQIEKDRHENMKEPYLYLALMGVVPEQQRKGLGRTLLEAMINKADLAKYPLYLETQKEENLKFYEKFDFNVIKKITITKDKYPIWEMIRNPIN